MASIIRSPVISEEKRKLSTRRGKSKEDQVAVTISGSSTVETSNAPDHALLKNANAQDVQDLVEQAKLAVLSQFKDEAESARELGRQRGLREGHVAGAEEAKKNFAAEFERIRSITDKLQQTLKSGNLGMEDMAVAIAFEAVCKVLGNVAVTYDGVQALVRQAAAQVRGSEKVVVRLHKSDLAILQDAGALTGALPSGATVSWVADKNVELGGCVIETDGGELDARLETQMDRLRAVLVAARASGAVSAADIFTGRRKTPDRRKINRTDIATERRKKSRRSSDNPG